METEEAPPRRRRRLVPIEWARRVRDRQHAQGFYLLPSLFTLANLGCGFVSILAAADGRWERAYLAIVFAMIFDVLDGAVARLAGASGRFGVELDTLCDVVSFGVAPASLLYYRYGLGRNWMIPLLFAVAGALRLARYASGAVVDKSKDHFQGLPIPAAAGMAVALVALSGEYAWEPARGAVIAFILVVSYLMISPFPYPSVRVLHRPRQFQVFAGLMLGAALLQQWPAETWGGGLALYALSGPAYWLHLRRKGEGGETPEAAA